MSANSYHTASGVYKRLHPAMSDTGRMQARWPRAQLTAGSQICPTRRRVSNIPGLTSHAGPPRRCIGIRDILRYKLTCNYTPQQRLPTVQKPLSDRRIHCSREL